MRFATHDKVFVMRQTLLPSPHHQRLLDATALWLFGGVLLLLTTLVPAHTELLGWTPLFWLIGAPLIVQLALEPSLPCRLLKPPRTRPRTMPGEAIWH